MTAPVLNDHPGFGRLWPEVLRGETGRCGC